MNIKWQNYIKNIEDAKIGLPVFLLLLSSTIFIRSLVEILFVCSGAFISIENLHHFYSFYLSAFLSSILLITYLSKEKVDKVSKVILLAYSIIMLVPIIDHFLLKKFFYSYVVDFTLPLSTPNWSLLARAYLTFYSGIEQITIGQRIEEIIFLTLSALYVFLKTKSTIRTLLTPVAVYTLTFFYATFPNYFSFGNLPETFNLYHFFSSKDVYYSSVFAILIVIQIMIWLLFYSKRKFLGLMRNLMAERSLHYLAMVGFGAFLAGQGAYNILLAFICVILLWQTAVAINDLHDIACDTISKKGNLLVDGTITMTEMKAVAISCGLLSLFIATMLSYAAILIAIFILALSALYSIPPLRLKKYPIISILVISLGGLLAFALGFYSGSTQSAFPINWAYVILVCFALAFNTKDLKDYEGDKENRIWTIPVIFGLKRGRIIIAYLDLLAYLIVPLILGRNNVILPAIVFGVTTFLVVLRKESKEWQIFLLYFLFLLSLVIMK